MIVGGCVPDSLIGVVVATAVAPPSAWFSLVCLFAFPAVSELAVSLSETWPSEKSVYKKRGGIFESYYTNKARGHVNPV